MDNGEAQIFLAKEAGANRRESSPPRSELSTGKMNPRLLVGTRGQCLGDNIKFSIHRKIFSTIFPCFVRSVWLNFRVKYSMVRDELVCKLSVMN